mgnify:CR=1 FL=1
MAPSGVDRGGREGGHGHGKPGREGLPSGPNHEKIVKKQSRGARAKRVKLAQITDCANCKAPGTVSDKKQKGDNSSMTELKLCSKCWYVTSASTEPAFVFLDLAIGQ